MGSQGCEGAIGQLEAPRLGGLMCSPEGFELARYVATGRILPGAESACLVLSGCWRDRAELEETGYGLEKGPRGG